MKRTLLLLVVALAGCGPDPLIGSYGFTISGLDTTTAPGTSTSTPMGTGTLAVTSSTGGDFVMTVAEASSDPCVLRGKRGTMGQSIEVNAGQTCTFSSGANTVTASISTGTATLTDQTLSLVVSYTFSGMTLGIGYSGTGSRTYAGPRL